MKTRESILIVLSVIISLGNVAYAQNAPIDFEAEGHGANWTWTTFENGGNEPFGIVANPSISSINASATVGSMTALILSSAMLKM